MLLALKKAYLIDTKRSCVASAFEQNSLSLNVDENGFFGHMARYVTIRNQDIGGHAWRLSCILLDLSGEQHTNGYPD